MIKTFYDAGVLISAGTDIGNPWMTPGVSFHRELELLVQAGLHEPAVLQIATRNGAQAMGLASELGTVAANRFVHDDTFYSKEFARDHEVDFSLRGARLAAEGGALGAWLQTYLLADPRWANPGLASGLLARRAGPRVG